MPRKKQSSQDHILLQNGCHMTQIKVRPTNWDQPGADITKTWEIWYRFYDPAFKDDPTYPYGSKMVIIKSGINRFKTLGERRIAVDEAIKIETEELVEKHYNPITGSYMVDDVECDFIKPSTHFVEALKVARDNKVCSHETYLNLNSVITYVEQAAIKLKINRVPISEIRRSHIKRLFIALADIKKEKWTNNNQNYYRSHLRILFTELEEWDVVEYNPIDKIKKKSHAVAKRKEITNEEREIIYKHLNEKSFRFLLFSLIFHQSGAREAEFMRLQIKNVSLKDQKFGVEVKKGATNRWVEYTITDLAVPYWELALRGAESFDDNSDFRDEYDPEYYLFSKGLLPGKKPISPKQISRRWHRFVKTQLGIDKDFYELKHTFTTAVSKQYGTKVAAIHNNETERMIKKHYNLEQENMEHEGTKTINISFLANKNKAIK